MNAARFVTLASAGSDRLAYTGDDIRRDIRQVYLQETSACSITYARSDGSEKHLGFAEVARRLYSLSFDPYHCAERRPGAGEAVAEGRPAHPRPVRRRLRRRLPGVPLGRSRRAQDAEELATCPDGADKRAWYDAERRLRNQPDRTYDVRMGFSLADLRKAVSGSGIDEPPGIDVLALLEEVVTGDARAAPKIYEPAAGPSGPQTARD